MAGHLTAGVAQVSAVDVEHAFGFSTFLLGPLAVIKSVEVSDCLDSLTWGKELSFGFQWLKSSILNEI